MNKLLLTISVLALMIGSAEACEKNNAVSTFLATEKSKTIEFQKKSWKEAKVQFATLLEKIKLGKKND